MGGKVVASVFIFLDNNCIDDALECGIKLSENADISIDIFGEAKRCMTGFLNPNDYENVYGKSCMLCDIADKYCHIYEAALLDGGMTVDEEEFKNSVIPYDKYSLGMYRKPRVAIFATILPDAIHLQKQKYDIPMLYADSEQLYIDMEFDKLCEKHENYKELFVGLMYEKFGKDMGYSCRRLAGNMLFYKDTGKKSSIVINDKSDEALDLIKKEKIL